MRKINAWLFVTLDSVIEAPEKWVIADDDMFGAVEADYAKSDALLLGRRTYETFAASWPERGNEIPNADWMNNTRKYVASTTLESPEWNNSTVIEGDVAEAVARLKQEDGKNIMVNGSGALVRTLMRDHLLDELRLFVHPVVVGFRAPAVRRRKRSRQPRARRLARLRQRGGLPHLQADGRLGHRLDRSRG